MIEATTNAAARRAFDKAHVARGAAMTSFWGWLFHRDAG